MFTTNLNFALKDLIEVTALFNGADNLRIVLTAENTIKSTKIIIQIENDKDDYEYEPISLKNEIEHKRILKRFAKLALYESLAKKFNIKLPWGSITGIRPTKLAYQLIAENIDYKSYMTDFLKASVKSVEMVEKVIATQKDIIVRDDSNFDFFIGIPFCPSRCLYCSFISMEIDKAKNYLDDYVLTIIKEITASKKLIKNLSSVYIGGGTPISLGIKPLEKILKAVGEVKVEYSVEAGRPDCINIDILKLLKDYNVSRICINPQTFSDKTLEIIGRKHTTKDTLKAYEMAKSYGFDINMDAIAGLNGETFSDFKNTIDSLVKLSPENITIHTLALKKGSKLKEQAGNLDDFDIEQMIEYSRIKLMENGYNPYYMYRQKYMLGGFENVGYAKLGKECKYNINIMEEISQNIAVGANAISKRIFNGGERIERFKNPKDIKTYLEKIDFLIDEKYQLYK